MNKMRISQYSANWRRCMNLLLIVALLSPLVAVAPVQAGPDKPKAHADLLKLAKERPNDKIRVIVRNDMAQMGKPGDDPEQAVKSKGGKVNKQLGLINGFAAELSGKEIEKLAKHGKVRWISLDAPLFSTAMVTSTVATVQCRILQWQRRHPELERTLAGDWAKRTGQPPGNVMVARSSAYCAGPTACVIGCGWTRTSRAVVPAPGRSEPRASATLSASATAETTPRAPRAASACRSRAMAGQAGRPWRPTRSMPTDAAQVQQSFDITPYIAANTQVRFIGSGTGNRAHLTFR